MSKSGAICSFSLFVMLFKKRLFCIDTAVLDIFVYFLYDANNKEEYNETIGNPMIVNATLRCT